MSWLDQLSELERSVSERLRALNRELEPLETERTQLQELATRLGLNLKPATEVAITEVAITEAAITEAATTTPATEPAADAQPPSAGKPAARTRRTRAKAKLTTKAAAKRKPRATKPTLVTAVQPSDTAPATSDAKSVTVVPRTKRAAKRTAPSRRRPATARPGQREQQLLTVVSDRPGITVTEIASELNVDATGLYTIVRRLEAKGELHKEGKQLRPASPAVASSSEVEAAPPAA